MCLRFCSQSVFPSSRKTTLHFSKVVSSSCHKKPKLVSPSPVSQISVFITCRKPPLGKTFVVFISCSHTPCPIALRQNMHHWYPSVTSLLPVFPFPSPLWICFQGSSGSIKKCIYCYHLVFSSFSRACRSSVWLNISNYTKCSFIMRSDAKINK